MAQVKEPVRKTDHLISTPRAYVKKSNADPHICNPAPSQQASWHGDPASIAGKYQLLKVVAVTRDSMRTTEHPNHTWHGPRETPALCVPRSRGASPVDVVVLVHAVQLQLKAAEQVLDHNPKVVVKDPGS